MKALSLLVLTFLFSLGLTAQQSQPFTFEVTEHDFGTIKEEDGPVTYEFKFVNDLDEPVRITNVRASCGCTTPAWTRDEIGAGESGFITAKYNTRNRPGPFRKSLTVYSTGSNRPMVLYIKGKVEPRPKTIEEEFPIVSGELRMERKLVNMGKVRTNGSFSYRYLQVYNQGSTPIVFDEEVKVPDYLDITFEPVELAPEGRGRIRFGYSGELKDDLGFFNESVVFKTNEPTDNEKEIAVLATVEEYFPPMTPEQMAAAPRLQFESYVHDFGAKNQGEEFTVELPYSNTGKKSLNIRKIVSSCECMKVIMPDEDLSGSAENVLKITVDTGSLRGRIQKAIHIYSNDPRRPTQMVRVTGLVRAEAQR